MIYVRTYTTIFYRFISGERAIQLVFYNNENKNSLLFNGFVFSFIKDAEFDSRAFSELEYAIKSKNRNSEIVITSIKYDFDVAFIKLANGDIIFLFFMMDDMNSAQQLIVYNSVSARYKWALGRFNETPEADIHEEVLIKNVEVWFEKNK